LPAQSGGSEWRRRYAQRATTLRELRAREAIWAGDIDWDPAGPYGPGIDGASYTPGWIEGDGKGTPGGAVVLIKTRAMTEVISGWESYGQMQDWLASRGNTGSGNLTAPPAARGARCVAEETVLAHMLEHPQDITAITEYLPPWTWTSDVRHDLAAAVQQVARSARRHAVAGYAATALEDRAASIPASQLRAYGGRTLRWALVYLARLDETPVTVEAARAAAIQLRMEDAQAASTIIRYRSEPAPRRAVTVPSRQAIAAPEFRVASGPSQRLSPGS
jgi:hypothetical protein